MPGAAEATTSLKSMMSRRWSCASSPVVDARGKDACGPDRATTPAEERPFPQHAIGAIDMPSADERVVWIVTNSSLIGDNVRM